MTRPIRISVKELVIYGDHWASCKCKTCLKVASFREELNKTEWKLFVK